jgi:uncharacterized caspase-like protein
MKMKKIITIFVLVLLVAADFVLAQRFGGPIDQSIVNPSRRAGLATAFPRFSADNVRHPAPVNWEEQTRQQVVILGQERQHQLEASQKRIAQLEQELRRAEEQNRRNDKERIDAELQRQRQAQQQTQTENRKKTKNYAVLIGVNDYRRPAKNVAAGNRSGELTLSDLRCCINDMTALANALRNGKFASNEDIYLLTDNSEKPELQPTKKNVITCLARVIAAVKPEDTVLVAFAGHGVAFPVQEDNGLQKSGSKLRSYICPFKTDVYMDFATKKWNLDTLISLADLFAGLEKMHKVKKIAILDACRNVLGGKDKKFTRTAYITSTEKHYVHDRSGRTTEKSEVKELLPDGLFNFNEEDLQKYRTLFRLSSCMPGQNSYEDSKINHGIFTKFLLEGINGQADFDRNNQITTEELARFTKTKTADYARQELQVEQTPVSSSNEFSSCVISFR